MNKRNRKHHFIIFCTLFIMCTALCSFGCAADIPDEIKVAFGKFYFFSLLYIIFFLGVYPFILMNHISDFSCGLIIGFLTVFYVYMILDTKKKVKKFVSTYYYVLIFIVLLSISFSVVKYFIWLEIWCIFCIIHVIIV